VKLAEFPLTILVNEALQGVEPATVITLHVVHVKVPAEDMPVMVWHTV
jgi:hypothetical protein